MIKSKKLKTIIYSLLLIVAIMYSNLSHAQLSDKKFNISFAYGQGAVNDLMYSSYSLKADLFLNEKISLNWNYEYLDFNNGTNQFHFPVGVLGAPLILYGLANRKSEDSTEAKMLIILGVIGVVLPDGVSFNIPINKNINFSPYINILGVDKVNLKDSDSFDFRYACSLGVKFTFLVDDSYIFSIFGETRKTAGIPFRYGGGVSFGLAF